MALGFEQPARKGATGHDLRACENRASPFCRCVTNASSPRFAGAWAGRRCGSGGGRGTCGESHAVACVHQGWRGPASIAKAIPPGTEPRPGARQRDPGHCATRKLSCRRITSARCAGRGTIKGRHAQIGGRAALRRTRLCGDQQVDRQRGQQRHPCFRPDFAFTGGLAGRRMQRKREKHK